jgi:hypothetical protein
MLPGKGRQQLPPTTISSTTQSLTIIPMYAVCSDANTHELSVNYSDATPAMLYGKT